MKERHRLFRPFVHIADVSKEQLARTVNEQAERIRQLDRHKNVLGRVLIAITQEPEAFRYRDGQVVIDQAALDMVKTGTQLTMDQTGAGLVLAVIPALVEAEEPPRILVPGQ